MDGITPMEREYIERRRNGDNVEVTAERTPSGDPIVSLKLVEREEPAASDQPAASIRPLDGLTLGDIRRLVEGPTPVQAPITTQAPAAQPEVVNEPKKDVEPELKFCEMCGWQSGKAVEFIPTEDDKEEFIRSVLGSRGFERIVTRLGGKLKMRFISPTLADEDRILEQLRVEETSGVITTPEMWWTKLRRYRAAVMLVEIRLDTPRVFKPVAEFAEVLDVVSDRFDDMPAHLLSLVLQGLQETDGVYSYLVRRASQPDFWGGSGE